MTQPLSVQLYTVRDALSANLPGTLQRIADIGYTNVEAFGFVDDADELAAALRSAGLAAPERPRPAARRRRAGPRAHLPRVHHPRVRGRSSTRTSTRLAGPPARTSRRSPANSARSPRGRPTTVWCSATTTTRSEFSNRIDGVSAYEVFADALSDDVVLELDTYWVQVGGDDPVAVIGKYGDKVRFLHVKDGDGSHDDKQQVAVGNGIMPIRDIIAAAPDALHVVEPRRPRR
ncbi:sugar phosphate isomerase/epimerase [Curtobacterium flaccumfaciens]|nr:sugar phosphate isomerase/epimerase [Curtobacterium flaccumfaciens]